MIDTQTTLQVILFSVPACGALVCALLLLKLSRSGKSPLDQKVLHLAVFYYGISASLWIAVIFFQQLPEWFVVINPFVVLATMIVYVTYFHLIFAVTKTTGEEKFPAGHYLLPVIIFCGMLAWSLTIPFEKQLHIMETQVGWIEEKDFYRMAFVPGPFLLFGFNLTYTAMCLFRAARYRRVIVNYSADEQRGSISWVYHLIFTMLLMLPLLACMLLLSGNARVGAMILLALFAVFKYTILAHNVLFENFVLVGQNGDDTKPVADTKPANIRQLESYMKHNKPYLKPKLKIIDIVGELNTNRTSLSMMINRYYGMNFCRYVNRFRLEEFEKMRSNPANTRLHDIDLVLMAGFSDWRGYKRVKNREDVKFK